MRAAPLRQFWLLGQVAAAQLGGAAGEAELWPDLPEGPERPELPGPVTRDRERAKRGIPRPGLAGGAAELRGRDLPEKPEMA